jgi:hypothetical protein
LKPPSDLNFVAFLQYSPRGQSKESKTSQVVTRAVKNDGVIMPSRLRAIDHAAKRVAQEIPNYPFLSTCFGPDVVLVPVPGSSLLVLGGLWAADRLCKALRNEALAGNVLPLLSRTKAVPKSATSAPGQRPTVETHYDSLSVQRSTPLLPPNVRFTIVDDVVTRGATLLACYARLQEAYPDVPINCFALIRTMSGVEVDSVLNPVEGVISHSGGHPHRTP